MSSGSRRGFFQDVAVGIRCADPTFYDPSIMSQDFGLGGGANSFDVPMPVPHDVGDSSLDETVAITYTGNWQSYPEIRITGPITDPIVTNQSTSDVLDFTGISISAGKYYDIDCRYGNKTVIDDAGVNKIADLTTASDLATFHIAPDSLAVPGGTNSIRVQGSGVTTATSVNLKYYVRYLGI